MPDLETQLRRRWSDQMQQLGWNAGQSQIDGIISAYSEPQRHYHDLSHLAYIFRELDVLQPHLEAPERCWMAAWYHDIIYDPRGSDNEALSAERAVVELPALGASDALVGQVRQLILATADHQSGGHDEDDALFLDVDFSILGAPPDIYDDYAAKVRQEYIWAPGLLYRQGRRKFLKSAQSTSRTFLTDRFESAIGEQARENMRREFIRLGGKL